MHPTISLKEAFSGIGTLTRAISDGMKLSAKVKVCGCTEIDGRYLALWSKAHSEGSTFLGSIGAYHPVELSVPQDGVRGFIAGVPCTGVSRAGISKNRLSAPEEHKEVGYLFIPTGHYIRAHRPDFVVFENVQGYPNTASAAALRFMLSASGYVLSEYLVDAYEQFNTPTQRKRWVAIASRRGKFVWNFEPKKFAGTLGEYLDAPSDRDHEDAATELQVASDSKYISRKQSEGCGFAMRLIDSTSTKCPTICASYGKRQPSATFVRVGESYRMIRPREVARIHGFPDDFELPAAATTSYEVMGQGVCYRPFFSLGKAIGEWVAAGMPHMSNKNPGQTELFAA